MPIEGIPGSDQRAAYAAAGGIVATGLAKKIEKEISLDGFDFKANETFADKLFEMLSPEISSEVTTKHQRKDSEEALLYQEQLLRQIEHKTNSIVKKNPIKDNKRGHISDSQEEEDSLANRSLQQRPDLYNPLDRIKLINEDFLKNYIMLTAKLFIGFAGNDPDIMEKIELSRSNLRENGLFQEDFSYLDTKTMDMVKASLVYLIKDKFYSSSSGHVDLSNWIIRSQSRKLVTDLLSAIEKDSISVNASVEGFKNTTVNDLVKISASLKLDLSPLTRAFNEDKIQIDRSIKDNIHFYVFERPTIKESAAMVNIYRNIIMDAMLEENIIKRFSKYYSLRQVKQKLYSFGIDRKDIEQLDRQARRVAWVKTITHLKELHLARILTSSSIEFDLASLRIEGLTRKAKRLGSDIPKNGLMLVQTGLIRLALETAQYKIQLLNSLQKMSYDKKRVADLIRLKKTFMTLYKKH